VMKTTVKTEAKVVNNEVATVEMTTKYATNIETAGKIVGCESELEIRCAMITMYFKCAQSRVDIICITNWYKVRSQ
jgi:hypothetical protein